MSLKNEGTPNAAISGGCHNLNEGMTQQHLHPCVHQPIQCLTFVPNFANHLLNILYKGAIKLAMWGGSKHLIVAQHAWSIQYKVFVTKGQHEVPSWASTTKALQFFQLLSCAINFKHCSKFKPRLCSCCNNVVWLWWPWEFSLCLFLDAYPKKEVEPNPLTSSCC